MGGLIQAVMGGGQKAAPAAAPVQESLTNEQAQTRSNETSRRSLINRGGQPSLIGEDLLT